MKNSKYLNIDCHTLIPCIKHMNKLIGTDVNKISELNSINLVHRIDKSVSGTLLYSDCLKCLEECKLKIKERNAIKIYVALVYGDCYDQIILNWIYRSQNKMACSLRNNISKRAKKACTYIYKICNKEINGILCTIVCAQLITGRTHQIRVQLSSINRPVVGDKLYGNYEDENYKNVSQNFDRTMLHSMIYGFKFGNLTKCYFSDPGILFKKMI